MKISMTLQRESSSDYALSKTAIALMIPQIGVVREGVFLPWAAFRMEHIPLLLKSVGK